MVRKYLSRIYMTIIFIFLYAPIIVLAVFSFNESKSRGNWTGFTLKWYVELFHDIDIRSAFYYTILIAITSAVISTLLGTIAAIGISSNTTVSIMVDSAFIVGRTPLLAME